MKKLYSTIILIIIVASAIAQAPKGINYQAVIRGTDGQVLVNQSASVLISLTNSDGSVIHYSETHNVQSNAFGLVTLVIGNGENASGNFNDIPWSSGEIYLNVDIMLSGATAYTSMGRQLLQSVPYALYAADGLTMQWLGSLANPPASPSKNQAYYNTFDKASYIWDGDSWEILAIDGIAGPQGIQGEQGPQGDK